MIGITNAVTAYLNCDTHPFKESFIIFLHSVSQGVY